MEQRPDTTGQDTQPTDAPAFLSFAKAGQLIGKDPRTLRRWEQKGKLTVDRATGTPRVPIAELERLNVLPQQAPGHDSQQTDRAPGALSGAGPAPTDNELIRLRSELEEVRADRDAWRQQAQALIRALPARAETTEGEDPEPGRRWWQFWR